MHLLFAMSLLGNALALCTVLVYIRKKGGWQFLKARLAARGVIRDQALERFEDAYHRMRVELIRLCPPGAGDLVMLGDSLTDNGPWHELLGTGAVRNQGIAGDTADGVLKRLDAVGQPDTVAVLIGINDLNHGMAPVELLARQRQILTSLQARRVIVQSLLPIDHFVWGKRVQESVAETNRGLQPLAAELGYEWLDLHALFLKEGRLDPGCSHDGLHLNAAGYARWSAALKEKLG
jgi:lysophospholipase L1-like esterase